MINRGNAINLLIGSCTKQYSRQTGQSISSFCQIQRPTFGGTSISYRQPVTDDLLLRNRVQIASTSLKGSRLDSPCARRLVAASTGGACHDIFPTQRSRCFNSSADPAETSKCQSQFDRAGVYPVLKKLDGTAVTFLMSDCSYVRQELPQVTY